MRTHKVRAAEEGLRGDTRIGEEEEDEAGDGSDGDETLRVVILSPGSESEKECREENEEEDKGERENEREAETEGIVAVEAVLGTEGERERGGV